MSAKIEKIALFIDGANLHATAKSLGFEIDYKRLLREFQLRGYLLRGDFRNPRQAPTCGTGHRVDIELQI
jgi:uncharacterized LabA/DUF88 family protein